MGDKIPIPEKKIASNTLPCLAYVGEGNARIVPDGMHISVAIVSDSM